MNTIVMRPTVVGGNASPSKLEKTIRLDQAQLAQEFAEKICSSRLVQIEEVLQKHTSGTLHSVEALFKIQEIANRRD